MHVGRRLFAVLSVALLLVGVLTVVGSIPAPASTTHRLAHEIAHSSVVPSVHPDTGGTSPAIFNRVCTGTATNNCLSGPTQRKGVSMAWDPLDGYLLTFAGGTTATAGLKNDTFKWQKGAWFPLANGPSTLVVRSNASLVYDAADSEMVLFGGFVAGASEFNQQTFKFVGGAWTLLFPTTRPQASVAACMVYVPQIGSGASSTGGYVLLFGGAGHTNASASNWYGYTWKFSAGQWTNISANVGIAPSARGYSQCTYDPTDGYVLLYGGMLASGALASDTFKFAPSHNSGAFGGNWSGIVPTGAPQSTWLGNLVYVTASNQVLLFQGAGGTLAAPTNPSGGVAVWSWTGSSTTWTNVSATVGFGTSGNPQPKPSYNAAMADIPTYSYAYRFAGETSSLVTSNVSYAVGNLLGGYVTENLGEIVNGGSMKYYSNASAGTPPYNFVYSSLPTGCTTSNLSVLPCTPSGAGVYPAVSVVFKGSDGYNVTIVGLSLTVDPSAFANGTLTSLGQIAKLNASLWWGVRHVQNPIFNSTSMAYQNQTPFTYIRTGANCDAYNYTANLQYASNGASSPLNFNWSALRAYVNVTHSKIIFCLGGQINNAGYASNQLTYIENTQHFKPAYMSIGNEPHAWNHFNKPFASWSASDNVAPTKLQYARMVQNYTAALHGVDPTLQIIGIQAGSGAFTDPSWINQTVAINGPNISAVAIHLYPQSKMTNHVPVTGFFTNLTTVGKAITYERQNISGACPTCKVLLFNDEFNSAQATDVNPWQTGYPQVTWIAAGASQEIQKNSSQFMFFDFTDSQVLALINSSTSIARPSFYLYANVLKFLNLGPVYNVSIATTMKGLYAVETGNNPRTLLVVNTNSTVTLTLRGLGPIFGNAAQRYTDDPLNLTQFAFVNASLPFVLNPLDVLVLVAGNSTIPPNLAAGIGSWLPFVVFGAFGAAFLLAIFDTKRRRRN